MVCELDHKEVRVPKNWCFWTVVLEKSLESHLDNKKIKPVNPKGNQPWIFTGRTDAEVETLVLGPSDAKSWLRKRLTLGKIEGMRRKGWQRVRWLDGIINSMDMNLSKIQEIVKNRDAWPPTVHGVANSQTWLNNNNILFYNIHINFFHG